MQIWGAGRRHHGPYGHGIQEARRNHSEKAHRHGFRTGQRRKFIAKRYNTTPGNVSNWTKRTEARNRRHKNPMAESGPFMRRVLSSVNFACQIMSVLLAFPGCQVRNVSAFGRDSRAPTFHPVAVRPQAVCKPQSRLLCGCDVPRGGTLLCFGVSQPWYTIGHTPPGSSSGRVRPVRIQGIMSFRRTPHRLARGPFRQISRGQ